MLFDAIADGRLHLTAVMMLAKHLTSGNVDELVAAATHKSKAGIQQLIAERFPQPDLPELLQAIAPPPTRAMTAPQGDQHSPENARTSSQPPVPAPGHQYSPENAESRVPRAELKPLAPRRFGFQCTLDQETYDLLQRARALTGHQNPSGEIVPVLKRALELLVGQLEKQKFAATTRPGRSRGCTSARGITAAVKRAVRERDGDRCAFVSDKGRRCEARARLEFDHIEPVARGGEATVENVRLVCRAHNQYAAERAFGAEFMERKRADRRRAGHRRNPDVRVRTSCLPTGP